MQQVTASGRLFYDSAWHGGNAKGNVQDWITANGRHFFLLVEQRNRVYIKEDVGNEWLIDCAQAVAEQGSANVEAAAFFYKLGQLRLMLLCSVDESGRRRAISIDTGIRP